MREPSRLRRLKAQYGQLVLRDEIRDGILRDIEERFEAAERTPRPSRVWGHGLRRRALVATGAAFALGLSALLIVGARKPAVLEGVVSTVAGQAFIGASQPSPLVPETPVPEGQWLRTSTSGRVETRVGQHRVTVGPGSDLQLESLRAKDLRFRLERGAVTLSVSPLGRDGHLTVLAGELSVRVVGTVFSVERTGACSRVSVASGRVAITYKELVGTVSAGESRAFCPAEEPPEHLAEPSPPAAGPDALPAREPTIASAASSPAAAAGPKAAPAVPSSPAPRKLAHESSWPTSSQMSDEERLFRDASRPQGEPWVRARKLQDYLGRFPEGLFAEDALFHLVRLSYADGNSTEVVRLSEQFLRRQPHGRRAVEVQLLYVQSAIELGLPLHRTQGALESVLGRLDELPRSQREQATYLAILAYCDRQKNGACGPWIRRYLAEFPGGAYASQVRRHRIALGEGR